MIRAAFICLASSGVALACDMEGERLVSEGTGAPAAFVMVSDVPLAKPFSFEVAVCGPEVPLEVHVDAIMPAHQHGMNYEPTVTRLGQGVYRVEGMLFHMPGLWQVRVDINFEDTSIPYTHAITLR